jgi:hypothetical protein
MASLQGLDDDHLRLLYSRATPQPFRTYTRPLRLRNPAREALPKLGIACSFSPEQMRRTVAGVRPPVGDLSDPDWRFVGLPTGHYPMLSRPDDLAEVLLGLSLPAADDGKISREE